VRSADHEPEYALEYEGTEYEGYVIVILIRYVRSRGCEFLTAALWKTMLEATSILTIESSWVIVAKLESGREARRRLRAKKFPRKDEIF
jgi:glycine cleavage system regulatory protein